MYTFNIKLHIDMIVGLLAVFMYTPYMYTCYISLGYVTYTYIGWVISISYTTTGKLWSFEFRNICVRGGGLD